MFAYIYIYTRVYKCVVCDVYAPVCGVVTESNTNVVGTPSLINKTAQTDGIYRYIYMYIYIYMYVYICT